MYSVCPRCRLRVVVSNLARARIRACQVPGDGSLGCMLVRGVGAEGACHARVRVGAALSRRLPWRSRHDTRRQAKPRHARRAKFVRWSVGRQTTTRWLLVGWWWWQWQWQWRQPAASSWRVRSILLSGRCFSLPGSQEAARSGGQVASQSASLKEAREGFGANYPACRGCWAGGCWAVTPSHSPITPVTVHSE